MIALARIVARLLADLAGLVVLLLAPRRSVAAENLFLRRQLALYLERGAKPGRVDAATRVSLALLSGLFDWRDALVAVRPETLIRWHRAGWRLFWRIKSRSGRPPIPLELRQLIRLAVTAHPTAAWTLQQLREVAGFDLAHQYLIHDRDSIFARSLDESIRNLGLSVFKSPPHSPKANAICERVIGTIRRE